MSFSNMKKNAKSNIGRLTDEITKLNKGSESYKDDRFWKPELDKSSNGYAVIRFLPAPDGEDLPWARTFNHGFKGKGGWFIENCPTTVGGKCPVCEANSELWNSGIEKDKDVARNRKRRLSYTANIFVVSDPSNPQNEGKNFLYKFGKKIFDKVNESMNPEFEDEDAINPFDFWGGANFKLKVRKVAGFINYDKSEFESSSNLLDGDDAKLEELWKNQYPLKEFTDSSNFKDYAQLKSRFESVVSGSGIATSAEEIEEAQREVSSKFGTNNASDDGVAKAEKAFGDESKEDDALSYFEKLAND
tara:strand:+ start:2167 stop:3075 length:909 start_codon:yes stop_codon:yes gene_type:complete